MHKKFKIYRSLKLPGLILLLLLNTKAAHFFEVFMINQKNKNGKDRYISTIGDLVVAIYDAALEEYMDEILARRIAMQALLRKLRQHDHTMEDLALENT